MMCAISLYVESLYNGTQLYSLSGWAWVVPFCNFIKTRWWCQHNVFGTHVYVSLSWLAHWNARILFIPKYVMLMYFHSLSLRILIWDMLRYWNELVTGTIQSNFAYPCTLVTRWLVRNACESVQGNPDTVQDIPIFFIHRFCVYEACFNYTD